MNDVTELPPRGLTLKPWWAWAVMHAGKRIENRSWQTRYRGRIAIHAGRAGVTPAERLSFAQRVGVAGLVLPDDSAMIHSAIVGRAVLVDCVQLDPAQLGIWGESGSWHWLLEDVQPIERPVAMPGKLGLWRVDHGSSFHSGAA